MSKIERIIMRFIGVVEAACGIGILIIINPIMFFAEIGMRMEHYQALGLPYFLLQDIFPLVIAIVYTLCGIIGIFGKSYNLCLTATKIGLLFIILILIVRGIFMKFDVALLYVAVLPAMQLSFISKGKYDTHWRRC